MAQNVAFRRIVVTVVVTQAVVVGEARGRVLSSDGDCKNLQNWYSSPIRSFATVAHDDKGIPQSFPNDTEERRIHDAAIDQDAQLAGESERPLVAEIRALGWEIDSIWDLVNYHTDHAELAPILLANLCENYHPKIKMAISGALISAKVRSEECSKALVAELQIVLGREGGQWEGVQQSLTHALAKLAHPVIAPALQALADRYQGTFLAEDLNEACKRVNRAK